YVGAEILDIGVGVFDDGAVVEHQEDPADDFGEEEEEGEAAHAPGEGKADPAFADGNGMQVEEDVAHDGHDARSAIARDTMAKNRIPNLRVANVVQGRVDQAHSLANAECRMQNAEQKREQPRLVPRFAFI